MYVSVVIPVYDGEADLPDLLACLRSQTYPAESVEYLIVDNNSGDRTAELLEDAAPFITPLSEAQIQSSYAARNAGIRAAKGEIVAFTDADCRPQPQWLEQLVEPFAKPEVGFVVGEIVALPGHTFWEKHAERRQTLSQKYTLAHPFLPYGQTANLAVRRAVFEDIGLFRPYLTTGGDADLCWRIQQETDWTFEFAIEAAVAHRHRQSLEELLSQMRRYGRSGKYLHELHGTELQQEFTWGNRAKMLARWLFRTLPKNGAKTAIGKGDWLDVWETPLSLLKNRARSQAQQQAQLPKKAREIERL